jgi:hypothetical protein
LLNLYVVLKESSFFGNEFYVQQKHFRLVSSSMVNFNAKLTGTVQAGLSVLKKFHHLPKYPRILTENNRQFFY